MKLFQDQGLDVIAEGLDTLKDMAHDMNEVRFVIVFILPLYVCVIFSNSKFIVSMLDAGTG